MQEIDVSRLSRDYSKEPLVRGETPNIHELKYLLLEMNLSKQEIANYFKKKSATTISQWQKQFNVYKTQQQILDKRRKTNIDKYGVGCSFQSDTVKTKICETNLKRYGTNWHTQSNNFKQKAIQTNIKKYGVDNFRKSKKYKDKYSKTCFKKYGVEHYSQTDLFKKKSKQTSLIRYGVDNYTKTDEYKKRTKETNNKKYGTDYFSQSKSWKSKTTETNKKKYGKEYYTQTKGWRDKFLDNKYVEGIQNKILTTKKKNGTLIISKQEAMVGTLLDNKFGIVKRQYRSEQYPFNCDFYIPSEDLYIEYNGNWTHGNEPFDSNSEKQKQQLQLWKIKSKELNWEQKQKEYYENAIYVWTDLDVRKRETAKKNALNWMEFFNIKQVKEWLKNQGENNGSY